MFTLSAVQGLEEIAERIAQQCSGVRRWIALLSAFVFQLRMLPPPAYESWRFLPVWPLLAAFLLVLFAFAAGMLFGWFLGSAA